MSYKTLRDAALNVSGGAVRKVEREQQGSNLAWEITVEPASAGAVTIGLPETTDCDASGAMCTVDGRPLSHSLSATIAGPVGISVADARVVPSWGGQATGGAEALWGRQTMAGMAQDGVANGSRLDAEVGYGLPLGSRFVGTPRIGVAATEHGREYRLGYGLGVLDRESLNLELGVDAHRRESPTLNGTDNGFLGRATAGLVAARSRAQAPSTVRAPDGRPRRQTRARSRRPAAHAPGGPGRPSRDSMARHYATRDFFRQMPNPLLARYFHARGVFDDLDIAALPEPQPDALWAAWLTLDDTQRDAMDAAFRDIAALSGEKGYRAILDDAAWHFATDPAAHAAFVEQLASLEHHGARAMTTFLDHPACWRRAARFCYAEALPAWRKRTHLPHVPAAVDEASLQALAAGLSTYFRRTEGRGTHCVVEPVRRGTLDYFFAYPEDYAQHSVEWVDGQFGQRPHHPAFEVIYVYSQSDGTLDVNIRGARPAVEPLQGLFAATILKQPALPPDPTDDRVYDLNALREPGFEFVYDSGSGIQDVAVTALRLASRVTTGDRLTLEADTIGHPTAIYDLIARLDPAGRFHLYRVTQVELAASVITDISQPPQRVTIRLTRPNACSLPYDDLGLTLRAMLHASGIEPKAPAEAGTPAG